MIMNWFRRHQRFMFMLATVLIVVSMAGWTILGTLRQLAEGRARGVGTIGGQAVSNVELHNARVHITELQRFNQLDPERTLIGHFIFSLDEQKGQPRGRRQDAVTDKAVWRYVVLLRQAERSGIQLTAEDMAGAEQYPVEFRRALVGLLRIQKMLVFHAQGVDISEGKLWTDYLFQEQSARVRYVAFESEDFRSLAHVTDDEVKEFYQKHKDVAPDPAKDTRGYLAPERVKVEYALARVADFEKKVLVTDREIEQYYEQNKKSYAVREDTQIGGQEAEPKEGGAGEKAAVEPPYVPLAEVDTDIRKALMGRKAQQAAEDAAQAALEDLNAARERYGDEVLPLERMARRHGLTYVLVGAGGFLSREQLADLIPGGAATADTLFGPDAMDRVISRRDTNDGPVLYQSTDRKPAAPWPLEEVAGLVRDDLETHKAFQYAQTLAGKVLDRALSSSLEEAVKETNARLDSLMGRSAEAVPAETPAAPKAEAPAEGPKPLLVVQDSGFFKRSVPFVEGISRSARVLVERTFALTNGQMAVVTDGSTPPVCYVIQKGDEKPADPEGFAQWARIHRPFILMSNQMTALRDWLDSLAKANPMTEAGDRESG